MTTTKYHPKFDQRPIPQAVLDRLLKLLDFSGIDGSTVGVNALPVLNRQSGRKRTWALPSTGCENTDFHLGRELGIALLCALTFDDEDGDCLYNPDPAPIDLDAIHEALSNGPDGYACGFWGTVQGFIDRALNSPRLHAETRRKLRDLARQPEKIRGRCKLVLDGYIPPEILSGSGVPAEHLNIEARQVATKDGGTA